MSSAVVPSTAANKSNENSDSDIEVVKELPSPPRHERNPQRNRSTQNGSYPSNQFHAGNGVGGNNVSVFTGQDPSHPSIQIVNGPYDRLAFSGNPFFKRKFYVSILRIIKSAVQINAATRGWCCGHCGTFAIGTYVSLVELTSLAVCIQSLILVVPGVPPWPKYASHTKEGA